MKDKSYRDKYYSKKIGSVIFSTIMYELMILLTILAFNMSEDIIELGEFGWDLLVFSVMSGWLLIMLVR